MRNRSFKILVLIYLGLFLTIPKTNAYYLDAEKSESNLFTAGILDIVLAGSGFNSTGMQPGDSVSTRIDIADGGNVGTEYQVRAVKTSGEDDFCNSFSLKADLNGVSQYEGPLLGFDVTGISFWSVDNKWDFTITFDGSDQDKECQFDFVYLADQTGGGGFSDEEIISNTVGSGKWINGNIPVYQLEHDCPQGTTPVFDRSVNISSTDADGEMISFTGGVDYLLQPNGTYQYDKNSSPPKLADAGYASSDSWITQKNLLYGIATTAQYRGVTSLLGDLGSGMGIIDWGSYTTSHTYKALYSPGSSTSRQFLISDWYGNWYSGSCANQNCMSDNLGNLTLDIYRCEVVSAGQSLGYAIPNIVINEILPNPVGDDDAAKPDGEWVELYNQSGMDLDVDGWYLYDAVDSHELEITASNTDTGDTLISDGGFLVVYRDGDGDFSLNNDGDTVRLYDDEIGSGGVKVDEYTYGDIDEDHSWARETAGSRTWVENSSPNPGTNPHSHIQVDISQNNDDLMIGFKNAQGFDQVKYSVFYDHEFEGEQVDMQIEGMKEKLLEEPSLNLDPLYIGSCSTEGVVCTPHESVDNMEIHLLYKEGNKILGTDSHQFDWQN